MYKSELFNIFNFTLKIVLKEFISTLKRIEYKFELINWRFYVINKYRIR